MNILALKDYFLTKKHLSIITASLILFSGCVISENIGKIGATTIGVASGAALGKSIGGKKGLIAGALIGGTIGYFIGDEIDKRKKAIENIIKEESKKQKQKIKVLFNEIVDDNGKKVGQSYIVETEKSQFDSGNNKPNFYASKMFENIAKEYAKSGMSIMIVGNTDADGSDNYNQKLSEERAKNIANIFSKNGVKINKMYYKGSGESNPIAVNNTKEGKAKNRRVEIVEVVNENMIVQYANMKKINNSLLLKKNINQTIIENNELNSLKDKIELTKSSVNLKPLNLLDAKYSEPFIAGGKIKKFKNQDIEGAKLLTGVSGKYYTSQIKSKEAIGSCNNKYAYSKKSKLDINWNSTIANRNELLSIIGSPQKESEFSLVTPAVADENILAYYSTCLNDKVRKDGLVKKLSTGEIILSKQNYELAPLLNGTAWGATIDNEFVMINPVGIKRANMQSISCPELNFIKKGSNQPWYGTTSMVVSYNGEKGLLYRIYPLDTSKIQCIDIAYPHGNPQDARGIMYYKNKNKKIVSKKIKFFALEK